MKKFTVPVLAALFAAASPAMAQVAPSQISPGMQVYDANRQLVGAIAKVDKGMATVATDKHEVPVNPASFALENGKLYLAMNREQLNGFYEKEVLAAEQSLAVGKPVKGLEGTTLGTIKEIDSAKVLITLASGQTIELPRNGIAGGATGATVGVSAADLAKQLGAAGAATATTNAAASTPAAGGDAKAGVTAKAGATAN
jgi:hypothetical protein